LDKIEFADSTNPFEESFDQPTGIKNPFEERDVSSPVFSEKVIDSIFQRR
jgi:hypothetical protein